MAMKIKSFLIAVMWLMSISLVLAQGDVTINLAADKTDFLLGEPVIVYATITNNGDEPIKVGPNVSPEEDFCYYMITGPDGKTRTFSPVYVGDRAEWTILNRGESVGGGARIFYGGEGYYFAQPGDYGVVLEYEKYKSDTLNLRVLPARNSGEREQAALILDHPEVGLFLMLEGSDELEDARNQMDTLVRKYPDAIVTSHLLAAEASNLARPARNFVTKKPRKADFKRSIEILNRLKDKDLSVYWQYKVVGTLSRCYVETGKTDSAKVVLENFKRKLESNNKLAPYLMKSVDQRIRDTR